MEWELGILFQGRVRPEKEWRISEKRPNHRPVLAGEPAKMWGGNQEDFSMRGSSYGELGRKSKREIPGKTSLQERKVHLIIL